MQPIDTAVVGAGPYGLSVAAHLRVAGVPHEIFGEPLESWRDFMPQGMKVKSEPFASNLWDPARQFTYEKYLAEKGIAYHPVHDPIPVERFLEYGEWFRRHAVGEVRRLKVRRVARADGAFSLELEDGTVLTARRVIVATGHMGFRYVPDKLKGLPDEICLHSTALHDPRQFAGRDVTVIGAGGSALESAALLHEAGATTRLVTRRKQITWNTEVRYNPSLIERVRAPEAGIGGGWRSWAISELPFLYRRMFKPAKRHRFFLTSWGPSGAWWLRERVEGKIDVLFEHQITSAEAVDGQVRLGLTGPAGATEILTDRVIAGTGFDVALDRIDCLDPTLRAQIEREGPYARLNAHFETTVNGLFIVGLPAAPVFGPVQRFMFGAKHAAPAVTKALRRSRARDAIDQVPASLDEPKLKVLQPD
jgi:cation diffusion facilitator CzcD-associated flavoprotein CzcO